MAAQLPASPPPQWLVEYNSPSTSRAKSGTYPDPPGFTSSTALQGKQSKSSKTVGTPRKQPTPEEMDTLKIKKAWELALAPAKQLPMNAFGMYMSGNSLQIFSIMMVFMLVKGPFEAVLNIQQTFARLETDTNKQQMALVKAAFVGCNMLALALGIWKVNGMGLLPYVLLCMMLKLNDSANIACRTTQSDWLAWESAREPLERAYFVPS